MANDRELSGSQPREQGATANGEGLGGSPYFNLAVDICHRSRGQGMEAMHAAIGDALDARLDPRDDEVEEEPAYSPCNCREVCRC